MKFPRLKICNATATYPEPRDTIAKHPNLPSIHGGTSTVDVVARCNAVVEMLLWELLIIGSRESAVALDLKGLNAA